LSQRQFGYLSATVGPALAIAGLLVGLCAAPSDAAMAPAVIASMVLARAMAGLGMVAFGVALMRLGERLLLGKSR
jgi:hypothetical protein